MPESCALVWAYFMDLHSTRTSNGFGANPITYTEIRNYSDLMQIDLDEWEVTLIRKFDKVALDAFEKAE